jgi:hypothetical protein
MRFERVADAVPHKRLVGLGLAYDRNRGTATVTSEKAKASNIGSRCSETTDSRVDETSNLTHRND